MAVKYTDEQLLRIREILEIGCCYADVLKKVVTEAGLDKVDGFSLEIHVEPRFESRQTEVTLGYSTRTDAGFVKLAKGEDDERYVPADKCSPEYGCLFIPADVAERMRKVLDGERAASAGSLSGSRPGYGDSVVRGVQVK